MNKGFLYKKADPWVGSAEGDWRLLPREDERDEFLDFGDIPELVHEQVRLMVLRIIFPSAHEDTGSGGQERFDPFDEIDAAHFLHVLVGNHEVKRIILRACEDDELLRFDTVRGEGDFTEMFENHFERDANTFDVIDDEDFFVFHFLKDVYE